MLFIFEWLYTCKKQKRQTRGALNFGLRAMCHQKDLTFFRSLSPKSSERPPFLPTFTQWPPIFNKLLVTERPWHIFVTQRPLIFAFNSETSDNFQKKLDFSKISTNLTKCWEIFGHFGPKSPYFLMHFTERQPIFVRFVNERPPFLAQFVTKRPLHLRCLVALVRHFHMWVPLNPGRQTQ